MGTPRTDPPTERRRAARLGARRAGYRGQAAHRGHRHAAATVRAAQAATAADLPEWAIVGSDGQATEYRDGTEWLDHWRHRVDGIETAAFPVAARRRALERLLQANAAVLRAMERRGRVALALDATAAAAQADGQLAAQEQDVALPLAAE